MRPDAAGALTCNDLQVSEDAVDRLLQKSQSAKLWLRGEVDFEDCTADGWFDMGVGRPYTALDVLVGETMNTNRESLPTCGLDIP